MRAWRVERCSSLIARSSPKISSTSARPRRTSTRRPAATESAAAATASATNTAAPLRGAVEGRRRERDEQRPDDEAGSSDGDVRREHPRAGAHGEGVGEERALHGDGGEYADAGEREYAEELPAVERRAREEQGEHRHRERDRNTRGRCVVDRSTRFPSGCESRMMVKPGSTATCTRNRKLQS